MYTYKRAVGISLLDPKGEELLDISLIPTSDLFSLYRNLVIVVNDQYALQDVAIDAVNYQAELMAYSGAIQAWLDTKASVQLVTSNTLPSTEYRFVTTHDIQYKWFRLLPGNADLAEDRQSLITTSGAKDIRVQKIDTGVIDYQALVERALWVVNGHLVRAVKGEKSIYLLNAGKHFRVNDNVHVNCLNFNTVSKLKTYGISKDDLSFEGHDTYSFLHYTSPIPLSGKTVWMSIGGRLYLGDVVQVNGEYSVSIRVEKVDWFTRIFDSKQLIDLSSVIDQEREVVGQNFFKTEEFFLNLLSDPSSFLIVLDNPHLYVNTVPVETYHSPFTYHTEETRQIPLMTAGGLLPKYFTRKIINRRLLDIDIGIQRKYLNRTTGIGNEGSLYHGFTNRYDPSSLHQGYLLYIRGLLQKD